MLREPPAGCQEPGPGGGPEWGRGRRVPPQEEAPGRGMGTGEGLHSGPTPQSRVARACAGEGHTLEYPRIWEQLWRCSWQARG